MPFSVSIGDGIAVAKLIISISRSLQDVGGARTDYKELLRELQTLQKTIAHLDTLQQQTEDIKTLDSIKFAALSCRQPLEEFLGKIKKYDRALGLQGRRAVLTDVRHKLRWTMTEKDAIDKLQKYLSMHVSTINVGEHVFSQCKGHGRETIPSREDLSYA